ncbi:hypothetical protein NUW54_g6902 [Trametes sanguinea]|uniref:Uncharacterized protein n=1 Tax=Trametes sanguinea TaxID=158606 RepID=A0ACC1PUB3_9APHY|nr:hypothetical protein NUW54_g6902 [Trametes sanguinea]
MLQRAHRREEFFDDAGEPTRTTISLAIHAHVHTPVPIVHEFGRRELAAHTGAHPQDVTKQAADFIRACLRFDYMERATAKELMNHAFLADAFHC